MSNGEPLMDLESEFFESDDYVERAATFDDMAKAERSARLRVYSRHAAALLAVVLGVAVVWSLAGGPPTVDAAAARPTMEPADEVPLPVPAPAARPVAKLSTRTLAVFGGVAPAEEPCEPELSSRLLAVLKVPATRPRKQTVRKPRPAARPRVTPAPKPAPKPAVDPFEQGLALYDAGDTKTALPLLERAARSGERSADALLLLGSIHQEGGRATHARRTYERFLQRQPAGQRADEVRRILARL